MEILPHHQDYRIACNTSIFLTMKISKGGVLFRLYLQKILILIRQNILACQEAGLFLKEDFTFGKITKWKVNKSLSTISIKIVKIFNHKSKSTRKDVPCLLQSPEQTQALWLLIQHFFPGPTALLKALRLLISGIFSRPYS